MIKFSLHVRGLQSRLLSLARAVRLHATPGQQYRSWMEPEVISERVKSVSEDAKHEPTLNELSKVHGSDKMTHGYTWYYERLFSPLRNDPITVIEIGIGGHNESGVGGHSLKIWHDYFSKGKIFGIDINDKSFVNCERIKAFCGSQVDLDFLDKVLAETGEPHIVIDDGSHFVEHQLTSFKHIFPRLQPGGIYVIEDIHSSYLKPYGGDPTLQSKNTTVGYFQNNINHVNSRLIKEQILTTGDIEKHIAWMLFAHGCIIIGKTEQEKAYTTEDRDRFDMAFLDWEAFSKKYHKRKRGDHDIYAVQKSK